MYAYGMRVELVLFVVIDYDYRNIWNTVMQLLHLRFGMWLQNIEHIV